MNLLNAPVMAMLLETPARLISLSFSDLLIIAIYFVVVLGIGIYLRRYANSSQDFFLAGRDMSAWVAGLSFLSANLGALELMGWAAAAYQYGILAAHFYWIAAFPSMVFLGLVMMPFYYISKTHSVPGYLQLRYGEGTRALSGISFAFMTILMSGINMYAMALVLKVVLGWNIHFSIWVASLTVAVYVTLGGLYSAIFNEVLQFFLIWLGALAIPVMGLIEAGGWSGMVARIQERVQSDDLCASLEHAGLLFGESNGRALDRHCIRAGRSDCIRLLDHGLSCRAACNGREESRSAKFAPIIASYFKMIVPLIVIVPGLLALAVLPFKLVPESALQPGLHSYNEVLPLMLARYCGPGLLGLGVTALIAGFMSGMAGNVSAFATVWTYDIYQPYIRKTGIGCALCPGGAMVHYPRRYSEHCDCIFRDSVQKHHGLHAGIGEFLHCSPLWHSNHRDVLEASDLEGRILGTARRHDLFSRDVYPRQSSSVLSLHHCALS